MPERFKVVFTMQGAIQVLGFTFTFTFFFALSNRVTVRQTATLFEDHTVYVHVRLCIVVYYVCTVHRSGRRVPHREVVCDGRTARQRLHRTNWNPSCQAVVLRV